MMGHKIFFNGEIWIIILKLSLLPFLIWSTGKAKQTLKMCKLIKTYKLCLAGIIPCLCAGPHRAIGRAPDS